MLKEYILSKLAGSALGGAFALMVLWPKNFLELCLRFTSGLMSAFCFTKTIMDYFNIPSVENGEVQIENILATSFGIALVSWFVGGLIVGILEKFRKQPNFFAKVVLRAIKKKFTL